MEILTRFASLLAVMFISACAMGQSSSDPGKAPCQPCEEVKNFMLPDVSISQSTLVNDPVPHCLVLGTIGKEINFELLLPREWNGRFVMGGGGGFVGSIQNTARSQVENGYVTAGTDTGHEGVGLKADWALNNMERQLNFGHLAVHRTAEVSKAITMEFYCAPPEYNYFIGCSRGGGQAMMEAQRYPSDFDGIVAGAPAYNWPALGAEFIQNIRLNYPDPANLKEAVISGANLELLQKMILEHCDALDGLQDNILNDPRACTFDLDQLPQCPSNSTGNDCFSREQIAAIKEIYKGTTVEQNEIYPGFPFGGENEEGGWHPWIVGPFEDIMPLNFPSLQFAFSTEFFKYLVFQDPEWDYSTYDFSDYNKTTQYASSYLDATSTDYSAFKERGGKMIIFHGWNDPALSALSTIEHYESAKKEDSALDDYIRLFLLPGVLHCGGGPGPGQTEWLEHVRNWVENGIAPEKVVMVKNDDENGSMARPVYPYPSKAVYKGTGDPNRESSFRKSDVSGQR